METRQIRRKRRLALNAIRPVRLASASYAFHYVACTWTKLKWPIACRMCMHVCVCVCVRVWHVPIRHTLSHSQGCLWMTSMHQTRYRDCRMRAIKGALYQKWRRERKQLFETHGTWPRTRERNGETGAGVGQWTTISIAEGNVPSTRITFRMPSLIRLPG